MSTFERDRTRRDVGFGPRAETGKCLLRATSGAQWQRPLFALGARASMSPKGPRAVSHFVSQTFRQAANSDGLI